MEVDLCGLTYSVEHVARLSALNVRTLIMVNVPSVETKHLLSLDEKTMGVHMPGPFTHDSSVADAPSSSLSLGAYNKRVSGYASTQIRPLGENLPQRQKTTNGQTSASLWFRSS